MSLRMGVRASNKVNVPRQKCKEDNVQTPCLELSHIPVDSRIMVSVQRCSCALIIGGIFAQDTSVRCMCVSGCNSSCRTTDFTLQSAAMLSTVTVIRLTPCKTTSTSEGATAGSSKISSGVGEKGREGDAGVV